MKLRIKGNSLRLRLTRGEVSDLNKIGIVSETVDFGSGQNFIYAIAVSEASDRVTVSFDDARLLISVPQEQVREWAGSEQVSISAADLVPAVLIEKDFACLEPRPGEDEMDMFPNPGHTFCKSA
jgi:hypothetical protein